VRVADGGWLVVDHTRVFGIHPTRYTVPLSAISAVAVVNSQVIAARRDDGGGVVYLGRGPYSLFASGGHSSALAYDAALWACVASEAAGRKVPVVYANDSLMRWGLRLIW